MIKCRALPLRGVHRQVWIYIGDPTKTMPCVGNLTMTQEDWDQWRDQLMVTNVILEEISE